MDKRKYSKKTIRLIGHVAKCLEEMDTARKELRQNLMEDGWTEEAAYEDELEFFNMICESKK